MLVEGATAVLVAAAPIALQADAVTMSVSQYVDPNHVRTLVFEGRITSPAAGEYVEVLGQDCGTRHERLITGVQTVAGGGWRIENPNADPPYNYTAVYSGTTFRARWNGQHSAPYLWRLPAQPRVAKLPGRRAWRVHVTPATPQGKVSLNGKIVELQHLSQGRWVRVRRARLVHQPRLEYGGAFNHEAVFTVATRGLTLRVFLPAQSAAPCYLAGASQTWRS